MSQTTSSLPCVLAGPILRRATPKRLTFWLALSADMDIRLRINPNTRDTQTYEPAPDSKEYCRLDIGERLKILLLDIELQSPLSQNERIEYSIDLRPHNSSDQDWQPIREIIPDILYEGQKETGFCLPERINSLLHGSCRKPHHDSEDGLVEADRLLEQLHSSPQKDSDELPAWPSLLIMSGDQIYADDVAGPMLRAIHIAIDLLGLPNEDFHDLQVHYFDDSKGLYTHEKCYYGRTKILPEIKENLDLLDIMFGGVKKPVFTTDTANNHLIALHENLMMYLLVWSPALWDCIEIDKPSGLSDEKSAIFDKEKTIIDRFVKGLPKVRRLFAHIPVAMIFDDHDVTDDWNLNRQWEEAVYNHPFSHRMVSNSLCAYFICQGWGNNPEGFDEKFIDGIKESIKAPGGRAHRDFNDHLLGFEGWEYQWETQPPLIVIDSRTRRWRSESSKVRPSGLLDWEALVELQHRLFDNKSVLLVAPAPIYGVKLIETIQRIFTWFGKPLLVDAENWMAHPGTANSILNIFLHSKTPQNFVILSGDVHYSFVYDVELRGRKGGPDIWQVTSSGFKNEFPKKLLNILDIINRWLYSPKSPLNWFTKRKRLRIIPRKPDGHPDGQRLLNGSGVGLVELDADGRPSRFRQLLVSGNKVDFHRMEKHSRWQ